MTTLPRWPAIVEEGLTASGAVGFSTSRTILHKSVDGEHEFPGTTATKEELLGIGDALKRAGHGVFELASDLHPDWDEFGWMGDLSRDTGAPVAFTALESPIKGLSFAQQLCGNASAQTDAGAQIVAQISMRGTGTDSGLARDLSILFRSGQAGKRLLIFPGMSSGDTCTMGISALGCWRSEVSRRDQICSSLRT